MSWDVVTIGDHAEVISGPAFKSAQFTDNKNDIPLIKGENIAPGYIAWEKSKFWPIGDLKEYERFHLLSGDIVLAMDRPWIPAGLKWAEIQSHDPLCLLVQRVARLRANEKLNQRFLKYLIASKQFSDYIQNLMYGVNVPHISGKQIKAYSFPLPDLPTQERIAGVLSAYDDLIENNRRRIALLELSARLLYREWFVHFRFPGHEATKFVDDLPEEWTHEQLYDLCTDGDGIQTGPFGSQLHQSDYSDEGVPVVMPKDMKSGKVDCNGIARIPEALADKLGRHRMIPGDTVFGRRGEIGRKAFIGENQRGFFCGTGCLRIRPKPEKIDPRYLFETLGSPATAGFIVNQAKGSTMPNLSAGALKNVPILCPPEGIQAEYVEKSAPIFEQVEILDRENVQLAKARDLLLPRLMDGRIPV